MEFALASLAVWRVTYMLVEENGPFDVFCHLRNVPFLKELLECPYCTSVWVAIPATFIIRGNVLTWLALSAVAIFINVAHDIFKDKM